MYVLLFGWQKQNHKMSSFNPPISDISNYSNPAFKNALNALLGYEFGTQHACGKLQTAEQKFKCLILNDWQSFCNELAVPY